MTRINDSQAIFKDIRLLRLLVVHPDDADREELTAQLSRIGCSYSCSWPALDTLPQGTDMVLMSVHPDTLSQPCPWLEKPNAPPSFPSLRSRIPSPLRRYCT